MSLYLVVKQWLLPPGIILIILAVAFFLVRGTLGRVVLFIGWSLLLIMSVPALSSPMIAMLEQASAIPPERVRDTGAEAIVVLGAATYTDAPEYGGDTVGVNSLLRIRYAAWLHRQTALPVYVVGGSGENAPGPVMAQVLREELQVPVAAVESESRDTWENATLSAPLLRRDGIGHVLLVTQAFHMPRARDAFERAGVEVTPAPTYFFHRDPELGAKGASDDDGGSDWLPQATAFLHSAFAVHEVMGQVYYHLRALLADPGLPEATEG